MVWLVGWFIWDRTSTLLASSIMIPINELCKKNERNNKGHSFRKIWVKCLCVVRLVRIINHLRCGEKFPSSIFERIKIRNKIYDLKTCK